MSEAQQKLVDQFPASFQDKIDGTVIGTGYDSLVRQMIHWVENVNRTQTCATKRKIVYTEPNSTDTPVPTKNKM